MLLHDRVLPLRPSRADRRKGLALRWPDVTRTEPVVDQLAVDVVNTGEDRWRPNGDSFHVVGTIQPAHELETRGASFAFIMGQDPALPLDPGEYARVRVVIDANQWRSLQAGRHHLHAVLAELDVRTDEPLELELTDELTERHRARVGPPSPPRSEQRSALRERLAVVRGLLVARDRLDAVVEIVAAASSDVEARLGIQELLDCEPSAAEVVYSGGHSPVEVELPGRDVSQHDVGVRTAASCTGRPQPHERRRSPPAWRCLKTRSIGSTGGSNHR